MTRRACFAAGVLTAWLSAAVAFVAGLWIANAGAGRHPIATVRQLVKEFRHAPR